MTESIFVKLLRVQKEAHAPKEVGGKFGKSRSAEMILEAYKPICNEQGLYLYTSDVVQHVGERNYIYTTATIVDTETGETHSASAAAWENIVEVNKYGAAILDTSQVSGKTSSYAKKYALQNLFAIDDTKDADNDDEYNPPSHDEDKSDPETVDKAPTEELDVLARAKVAINEEFERQEYLLPLKKKAFITKVLGKSTIDTLNDADAVMDQLENEA